MGSTAQKASLLDVLAADAASDISLGHGVTVVSVVWESPAVSVWAIETKTSPTPVRNGRRNW